MELFVQGSIHHRIYIIGTVKMPLIGDLKKKKLMVSSMDVQQNCLGIQRECDY